MDENNQTNYLANEELPEGFDLEAILAEFQSAAEPGKPEESLSDRSKRIVLETLPDALDTEEFNALGGLIESTVEEEAPAAVPSVELPPEPEEEEPTEAAAPEITSQQIEDAEEAVEYAAADAAEDGETPEEDTEEPETRRGAKERFLSPLVALAALIALRRSQRVSAERQHPTMEDAEENIPEMPPEKAAKLYSSQLRSLRFRGRVATVLSLIMLYLSFAYYSAKLPLTGALYNNVRVLSLVLMIFEMAVMMAGLDVFTAGMVSIARRRMNAESLVSASCVFSLLDAVVTALFRLELYGLPFCAVSAISLTFAVWGSYYTCRGYRTSFRVLTMKKNLYTVSGERGIAQEDAALLKSTRTADGFVRRTEEADIGEYCYATMAPFLLIAAVILGLLASIGHGQGRTILHCISVLVSVTATFSCTLCFSLPFFAAAKKLYPVGAAIAGWSGVRDIGRSRHVVITDSDVFPKGTVEITNIRVLEGAFIDKVISYTASVVTASGSGLTAAFAELVRRNGYTINRVENFEAHDGGGMTAMVNGESVCIGNTGFMNLMGIRLPQKLSTRSSLYTAVNGSLVGIFTVEYKPVSSVQDALVLLLRSRLSPIFAIRDFNITPQMIKLKFKMPTDSFKFPAYSERYRISAAEPGPDSRIAAVLAREGMGPLVDVAERGRRLYTGVRTSAIISVVGSIFGLLLMFVLCWIGAFDSATASNVITFMLLWLIPTALIVIGMHR